MNATHTNRLAGLLSDRTALRQPTFGGSVAARPGQEPTQPAAPTHWLRRLLDNLMRTLAAPAV